MSVALSIQDLADSVGLTRRAVRFYVQQKLLPAPEGAGRGSFYNAEHLERLRRITELQRAGHSLDGIRQILAGKPVPAPSARPSQGVSARLWSRVVVAPGVELHLDVTRHAIDAEKISQLRERAREVLGLE